MSFIRYFIRELRLAVINYDRNRFIIHDLKPYLISGNFYNSPSFDVITCKSWRSEIKETTFASKNKSNQYAKIISILFNNLFCYKIDNNSTLFRGVDIVISSSKTEFKVFDYQDRKVLTRYKSLKKMKMVEENKKKFSNFFNVPATFSVDYNSLFIIEEFITKQEFKAEIAIDYVLKGISKYIEANGEVAHIEDKRYRDECVYFESRFGYSSLLETNDTCMIYCFTHGDLWASNIIFDGKDYYITDFERAGDRYFLFDFFLFIFTEWQLNDNARLIEKYFAGEYDNVLRVMFNNVHSHFYCQKKDFYFVVFLTAITSERWKDYNEIDNKIIFFISNYIPSYNA